MAAIDLAVMNETVALLSGLPRALAVSLPDSVSDANVSRRMLNVSRRMLVVWSFNTARLLI